MVPCRVDQNGNRYGIGNLANRRAPSTNDTLVFDGTSASDCRFTSDSSDQFAAIQIMPQYRGTIHLWQIGDAEDGEADTIFFLGSDSSNPNAVAQSQISSPNAGIQGYWVGERDENHCVLDFKGSPLTINASGKIEDVTIKNDSGNTATITGGNTILSYAMLLNSGTLNWTASNTISLTRARIVNGPTGTFNITGNGTVANVPPANANEGAPPGWATSRFDNNGTLISMGMANIAVDFVNGANTSQLLINGGQLSLTGREAEQRGGNAITTLNGGGLNRGIGQTYYVMGGWLTGVGTIVGNVDAGFRNARNLQQDTIVYPGMLGRMGNPNGRTGTLYIVGSFTMGPATTLVIRIEGDADSAVSSRLDVRVAPDGSGGNVTYGNATIIFDRMSGTPPSGTTLGFLACVSRTGFFTPVFRNNLWNNAAQAQNNLQFSFAGGIQTATGVNVSIRVGRALPAGQANAVPGNPDLLVAFQGAPDFTAAPWIYAVYGSPSKVGQPIYTANGGSFMALSDGSYDYVPPSNGYTGPDTVTYTVTDGNIFKDATITFYIPSTTPAVTDSQYPVAHDTQWSVPLTDYSNGLLDNATNFDPATVGITQVNGNALVEGIAVPTTAGGSVMVYAAGNFTYQAPQNGYIGPDSFTYTVSDANSSVTATVNLNVVQTRPKLFAGVFSGPFTGAPFAGTDLIAGTVAGVDNALAASLQGVTPTLTYFAGWWATGTPLSGPPTAPGRYTVEESFAGSTDYRSANAYRTFTIWRARPVITWNTPADITYGTLLDGTNQLDASASFAGNIIAGNYAYSQPVGTVLNAGTNQTLSVTFTPADTSDYKTVTQSVVINVNQATPIITLTDGGAYTGSPMDATALVAGVVSGVDSTPATTLENVPLTLVYYAGTDTTATPLSGAPSAPGAYTVVATFQGSADYVSLTKQVGFTITPPVPVFAANYYVFGPRGPSGNVTEIVIGTVTDIGLFQDASALQIAITSSYLSNYTVSETLSSDGTTISFTVAATLPRLEYTLDSIVLTATDLFGSSATISYTF